MKTKTIVITAVCASGVLFIGVIALCAGSFFLLFRNIDSALSPKIDELFAAMNDGTFAKTYDTLTSAELRQTVTREQYQDLGLMVKARLGKLQSKSLTQFNVNQFNADRYADVVYNAVFEHGSGTISARFKKEGPEWRLVSLHVDSPEFQKDVATARCPYCGAPHAADAKFCPKCGKRLPDAKEKQPAEPADSQVR